MQDKERRGLITKAITYQGGGAGFLFGADRAVTGYENRELGYMDEEMFVDLQKARYGKTPITKLDKALTFLNDNRWTVIGK
jgi:hypothetical protein